MPNVFSNPYQLDDSISNFRVVGGIFHYTPRKLCLWWGILSPFPILGLFVVFFIIPPANFVCGGVYCFHVVRPCVRPSVTFCFLNNLKRNCWIFIKLCKNIHICKTNTLDKKVRARGQFYKSYFPL